jgi:hypothetical protein
MIGQTVTHYRILEKLCEGGSLNFGWIRRDPDLANIHQDPDHLEMMAGR